ncbi:hypothetical protein LX36DRAFT_319230 [Colletotrichum falcatum]|nr:hypothetical protein LX36DRAFT_319230 [Colletotrichum falcatum]
MAPGRHARVCLRVCVCVCVFFQTFLPHDASLSDILGRLPFCFHHIPKSYSFCPHAGSPLTPNFVQPRLFFCCIYPSPHAASHVRV